MKKTLASFGMLLAILAATGCRSPQGSAASPADHHSDYFHCHTCGMDHHYTHHHYRYYQSEPRPGPPPRVAPEPLRPPDPIPTPPKPGFLR